jgi:hypothetical protein
LQDTLSKTRTQDTKVELEQYFKDGNMFKIQKNVRELDNFILSPENGRKERAEKAILKAYERYIQSSGSVQSLSESRILEPNLLIHQIKTRAALEKAGYKVGSHHPVQCLSR